MKVIYYGAEWCSPCKVLKPMLESVIKDGELPVKVVYVDIDQIDEDSDIKRYGIRGIPTLIKADDFGEMVSSLVAPKTRKELKEWLVS